MIDVQNASKRFGSTLAVADVSFHVAAGEIVGFLGPNGAGKTTVLRMLASWLPPTSGRVRVAGLDPVRDGLAVRQAIGYLPEHAPAWEGMRADRFLRFVALVRGLRGDRLAERLAWVVEQLDLAPVLGKRVRECSKGFRQRLGVAAALVHDPRVLLLDEPTHGLDPMQVAAFRRWLRGLSPGRAILFSSHVLAEVVAVSDRVLVIGAGRLLADVTVEDLKRRAAAGQRDVEAVILDLVAGGEARA